MKVLVTGGCGFLGSHVCEYYVNKGWDVISYDNMTKHELNRTGFAAESARQYNWNYLNKLGVKLVKADVSHIEALLDNAKDADFIIHTAAQPAMTISWENPRLDFYSNALGTFNCLEAARILDIPVVSCASVHVYGNNINAELISKNDMWERVPVGIDENYPTLGGTLTPLHASKAIGDIYTKVYIDTYKLTAASFRLSGIYGTRQFGGEDHGWVANFSIRSVLDWPITIFGNGWQVRDIVYVTDVCRAFDKFFEARVSGIYNIGGGEKTKITLLNSINIINKLNGANAKINFSEDRHGDLRYFVCDISKAKEQLNWEPLVLPEEGIENLLEWVKNERDIFI